MATINVKDAAGATVSVEIPNAPGRAAAAASRSIAFSTEDFAVLDGLETLGTDGNTQRGIVTEAAPASDTASSGLNGRLQRIAQRLTSLIALVPASLGAKAGSASFSTVPATDAYTGLPAVSTARILSAAATTNATVVKASAGAIKGVQGYNARASAVYLKLYNKATSPTVGTDTPVKTLYLPATSAFVFDFPAGYAFATGIALAMTTVGTDADATALTAADVLALNVDYL